MPVPRWLNGKTPQEKGRHFEKKLAKRLGGRTQPASGALPFYREDVVAGQYLIQAKRTDKQQYTLKVSDLNTLVVNAVKVGKLPLMILWMGGRQWAIAPYGVVAEAVRR